MKKLFFAALATMMLTGCGKEGYDWGNKEVSENGGYGQVTLAVNEGQTVYVKSTSEAADTYNVITVNSKQSQLADLTGEYGAIKGKTFTVPVESYTMTAENITPKEAEEANDGRGTAHYKGSTTFNVTASPSPLAVSFNCTMDNAKVTFDYDNTFINMFHMDATEQIPTIVATPSNSLVLNRSVKLIGEIHHTSSGAESFYTVNPNGTELSFTITAARKSDGKVKAYSNKISLSKQTWHKVKIAASSNNGQTSVTINVDGTITIAEEVTVNVDPFETPQQNQ